MGMTMTRAMLLLILLAIAMPLAADEPRPKPDYSEEAMFRFAHEFVEHRSAIMDFDLGNIGAIDIYKYGVHTRLNYLPFLAPLIGTRLVDVATVPNAFTLTNTPIARSMPYMPDGVTLSPGARRELKRVLKIIAKEKAAESE
jgi:hypothetical protein